MLAAQVPAIVLSILLAFAIDAWWSQRQLRDDERAALRDLGTEFRANLAQINAAVTHHETSIQAGERLLKMVQGTSPVASPAEMDSLLMWALVDFATFDPVSASLDDLLTSGRLTIISDDTLRMVLAGWPAAVNDAVEEEDRVVRFVENALLPYLTPRVATVSLYRAGHEGFGPFDPSLRSIEYSSLLEDPQFESHVANRMAHERQARDELVGLLRPISEWLVARLDQAPG
jgi:hypothetical protein